MSGFELQRPESYTQEDVQQILQLALANKNPNSEELSRTELLQMAEDLDIQGECLEAAEKAWLVRKSNDLQRVAFDIYRKDRLKEKAIGFGIVNTFLISLNLVSAGTVSWALYIFLIWGLKLSLDTWKTFQSKGEGYERAFQSWKFKQEMKTSVGNIWEKVKQGWQT
ncbi:MAG: 2TM domain-containing protein [Prochloraceae cyanobacterium]